MNITFSTGIAILGVYNYTYRGFSQLETSIFVGIYQL